MTLSPKLGIVEISTLWHFRLPLPIQMIIKVVSSPRLSGIGMPSPILWSHPLKMQRIVLLSSLLWWELGTNSLITGPGEWLSFPRFTSKLSWSWKPRLMINVILQFLGLDLFNIKLSAKFYQNIPNGLIVNFHFFQNLNLGKTSTNPKCHLTISWATSCQYTNVYAKFHHNIPLSSRDSAIITFSEFGVRQSLDQWKMSFHNLLG